jgi:multicomponent Na+:H+ antiporter subunit E
VWQAVIPRLLVFAALWWGLTEGQVQSWLIGVPAVAAATTASYYLRAAPGWHWTLTGAVVFAGSFVWRSLRAGIDVAWRTLTLDLAPRIITYRVSLQHPAAITFFAGAISLLPGTLTTAIEQHSLRIHVLTAGQQNELELARLERHIAALFGERL